MKERVLILGSGKMARNLGLYFLEKRFLVIWLSRSKERLGQLERFMGKAIRRRSRLSPDDAQDISARFSLYDENNIQSADIVIETINESLKEKQEVVGSVRNLFSKDTLLLSNSSSILPQSIHQDCAGFHFFYPVELTNFAEIIFPPKYPEEKRDKITGLAKKMKLSYLLQSEDSAFAVNRLLLPMQAEAVRALLSGHSPEDVDECSRSDILPVGQLSLMDSVGLDVIHAAVCNYMERMSRNEAENCIALRSTLARLIDMGKLGNKNRSGFLSGDPLPWQTRRSGKEVKEELKKRFLTLFINTSYSFIDKNIIDKRSLELVLKSVFNADATLDGVAAGP